MNKNKILVTLRQDILKKVGHTLECPSDFDHLVLKIEEATGEHLSATTLKRLYDYIPSDAIPRKSTLNLLCRYLGFAGWSDYVEHRDSNSGFISTKVLPASRIREGDMVRVTWGEDRDVTFLAIENPTHREPQDKLSSGQVGFAVVESINSKLKDGDTMNIMMFMVGQPLQVKDVIRDGENIGNYTAGLNGGLKSVDLIR